MAAFLISGVVADAGAAAIGEDYLDADGNRYLALLVQPVIVLEAGAAKLKTVRERALRRGVPIALYTWEMFITGHDAANRAAVKAVAGDDLDIVGIALRAPHRGAARAWSPPVSSRRRPAEKDPSEVAARPAGS